MQIVPRNIIRCTLKKLLSVENLSYHVFYCQYHKTELV